VRAAISRLQRSFYQCLALLVLALVALPGLGHAGLAIDVTRITIDVIHQRTAGVTNDYAFEIVVEGSGLISAIASVQTPEAPDFPSGELLNIVPDEDNTGELIFEAAGFASLDALQRRFANGTYTVTINGSAVGLVYNQAFPDGTVTATLPANSAMIPNGQPTFTYTDTCTNCNAQEVRIEDDNDQIDLVLQSINPTPLRSSIEFSEFPANIGEGGAISELPQATALNFCVVTLVLTQTPLILGGVDAFDYRAVTGVDDLIQFTVVAPGPVVSDVIEVFIEYLGTQGGTFNFESGIEGGGLVSGTMVAPNQAPVALNAFDGELGFQMDGFADEAALGAAFPPTDGTSKYVFSIDGGQKFFSADFMPDSPDGAVHVTSPTDGETVSSTPTIVLSNDCMNCGFQFVEVEDQFNFGGTVGLNADSITRPFATMLQVPDDFNNDDGLGEITELPNGGYFLFAGTGVGGGSPASTTPTDVFELFAAFSVEEVLTFTVPEPSSAVLGLAACAALAVLARRRQATAR
jgi:hypothetical protein